MVVTEPMQLTYTMDVPVFMAAYLPLGIESEVPRLSTNRANEDLSAP
jgi:hypothetical protein